MQAWRPLPSQALMDLRMVFETMEDATRSDGSEEGEDPLFVERARTQLALLQLLLDPARGAPRRKLHAYVG